MGSTNEEIFTTWTKSLDDTPVSIVYLCGELDASSVPMFLGDAQSLIDSGHDLIMDTHLLSYIDSTGLSALFSIKQALQKSGHRLCIVGAHGLLIKIMHVARADSEFRCYETLDDAIADKVLSGW